MHRLVHLSVYDTNLKTDNIRELGLAGDAINKASFPLPTLRAVLDEARRQVHQGQGFAIIRGTGLSDSAEDNTNMFLGLASYIGDIRGIQDKQGSMLST